LRQNRKWTLLVILLVLGSLVCLYALIELADTYRPRGFVALEKYLERRPDEPLVTASVPAKVTEILLKGHKLNLTLTPKDATVKVPVGKWRLHSWSAEARDARGISWTANGICGASVVEFEAKEGAELALNVGEPFEAVAKAEKRAGTYSFTQVLRGKNGEEVTVSQGRAPAPPPRMRIRNADGTYDNTLKFEYG
jgi:hypothetical protein